MSFFALSGLINCISATLFGLLVFLKGPKRYLNQIFGLMTLAIAIWSFSYWRWLMAINKPDALFWVKMLSIGSILIPIFYLHWILILLEIERYKKKILVLGYLIAIIFLASNLTSLFIEDVKPVLSFSWWPKPGLLYHFYLFFSYIGLIGYSLYQLIKSYKIKVGYQRTQIKYVILGTVIGFVGGATNFLLWYGFPFPPLGNILVAFYPLILAYAIIKYRLMDIRVVLGRGAIYLFSFITIIALAFFLMFLNNLLAQPLSLNVSGPLIIIISLLLFQPIFRLFENLASKYFYYVFYSYQKVLTDLGKRLTQFLDLDTLASLITNTLIEIMKLERTVVLLREEGNGDYKIQKNIGFKEENGISLVRDNFLTLYLENTQKPLVYEELSLIIRDTHQEKEKEKLEKLRDNMKRIEASLCLPLLIEEKIIGLIVLGNKLSGEPYSVQDIELLTNLANQSSIALQNARLYGQVQNLSQNLEKRVKEQVRQIQQLSEMKSEFLKIVNHQLRTPTSIIKGMLSMLVEGAIEGEERKKEAINKIYTSAERLETILDDLLNAQDLIGTKPVLNLQPSNLEDLINKGIEHFSASAKQKNLFLVFKKPVKSLPPMLLDSLLIERVLKKLIDNAIIYTDQGGVTIKTNLIKQDQKEFVQIIIQDTGIGITEQDKQKLFHIFSRGKEAEQIHPNGSGLGLYIAKEYIEAHQGKIEAESQGKNKGTTFIITLPIVAEF